MLVESLAVDGAGPFGMLALGALERLHNLGVYNVSDIKTFHGISSGALLGVVLSLDMPWETVTDYFVHRPWATFISEMQSSADDLRFDTLGICKLVLVPLLTSSGLLESATLSDLHRKTGKTVYITTTELRENRAAKAIHMSYKSHPELSVVEACARSCALYPLFTEIKIADRVYVDGGFATGNCSLSSVVAAGESGENTIHIEYIRDLPRNVPAATTMETLAGVIRGLKLLVRDLSTGLSGVPCVTLPCYLASFSFWSKFFCCKAERRSLLETGSRHADLFVGRHLVNELFKGGNGGL